MLAFALIVVSGANARPANGNPGEIKGHSIGETAAAFLSIEPGVQQEADACRQHTEETRCARLLGALEGGQRAEISASGTMDFTFDGGKLVRLTMPVDGVADFTISELTTKFGPQSRKVTILAQNMDGAKWENCLFAWNTPNVFVTLYQDNDPFLQGPRLLLVLESRSQVREDTVSVKQLGALHNRAAQHPAASGSQTAALQ
jgi:hypothetical protein